MAIGSHEKHVSLSAAAHQESLLARFHATRDFTLKLVEPLSPEDCSIQSMPDASPTRWHLAHTTWFFETFLLKPLPNFSPFNESFEYLYNSYYNAVGKQFPRDQRGTISRPSLADVLDYRQHVDHHLTLALEAALLDDSQLKVLRLGIEHEQQHQELILTDIKHALGCNPLFPVYRATEDSLASSANSLEFISIEGGLAEVGHAGHEFAFDNEMPRHKSYVAPFSLANRCVTNGEYLQFIEDDGYRRPESWLSMGWHTVQQSGWQSPMHWHKRDDDWYEFTLAGLRPLVANAPVCHISYFEADAFARWSGARLPTEFEWETAITAQAPGYFADQLLSQGLAIQPTGASPGMADRAAEGLAHMLGDVWEWTASQYGAYPGFAPNPGAIGEYNGKFMCNQFVLRGGSCATPTATHVRSTYRNFFPPETRWQFSGIRLARSPS